jgi:DNA polymerase-3 subunit epsilon
VREEDAAVHGLRESALREHAPFSEEWGYFLGLRERGPLAAHYSGVENGLLKSVWPYPRAVPDFARPGASVVDWGPWVDSARLCADLLPAAGSGRLEVMVAAAGLQSELDALAAEHCPAGRRRYHAALYDALAGALLLTFLARDPRAAGLSMMQLLALSTLDPVRRDALQQGELF